MGVDISVCFAPGPLTERDIMSGLLGAGEARVVYLVLGTPRAKSAGQMFFSLWSDGDVSLPRLCEFLSRTRSPICLAWKAEHGGTGGYLVFENGKEVSDIARDEDYLRLPSEGVELTFGRTLDLSERERLSYPESLLREDVLCFRLAPKAGESSAVPSTIVKELREYDIVGMEPVLPVDL